MKRDLVLWLTLLASPAAWFLNLNAKFALTQWKPALFAISGATLAVAALSGSVAWREWRNTGPDERARSMALGGVVLSGLFFLVILAQAIPDLMLTGAE
jgi:hypothetical protein